jgi:hypothetical protein
VICPCCHETHLDRLPLPLFSEDLVEAVSALIASAHIYCSAAISAHVHLI